MQTDHNAAGSSTEDHRVGRVDMDAGSRWGANNATGPASQSPGALLLVSSLLVLLMIVALILIFHNAFRIG